MQKWTWKILRWLNAFLIIALILAYLSPYISPIGFWPISFFGLAYPWLLFLSIGFLILWGVRKERVFFLTLLSILTGWNHLSNVVGFSLANPVNFSNKTLTVLTNNSQNMRHTEFSNLDDKLELTDNFVTLYKKFTPDILCIQEAYVPTKVRAYFDDFLGSELQIQNKHSISNLTMYSKFPIVNKGEVEFGEGYKTACLFMDVKVESKIIRIYNIHLQSNRITSDANKVISEKKIKEKNTWLQVKSILGRVHKAGKIRALQANKIRDHIAGSPHPVIVCGDFNDIPVSYSYHQISKGLKDSFIRHPFGLGATYAGLIPALRIDYILASPSFQFINHTRSRKTHSDHYPVVSEIAY